MSRVYTLIAIVILIPVLLLGAAFFLLANPEYYRGQLTSTFEDQTGFELDIKGDIRWRYWPPIALDISDVKVRPPGAATPLASVEKAGIDLNLLALLTDRKTLSINAIHVDGVTVNALVDKAGHPNWVVKTPPPSSTPTPSTPGTPGSSSKTSGSSGGGLDLEIHKIDVKGTTLNYKDESAGADYTVTIPSLATNALRYDEPMRVTFNLHAVDNTGGLTADLDGNGDITVGHNFSRIGFSRFDFGEKLQMAGLKDITSKLRIEGNYDVDASKFKADIDGKLNTSTLRGSVAADLTPKTAVTFDLNIDQLSAAEFLPETTTTSKKASTASAPPADIDVLPLDTLNSIVLHGKASVGSLAYDTYKFSDAKISVDNQDKKLTADASVNGYDGKAAVKFDASTDGTGNGHTVVNVDGIDITKLTGFTSITGTLSLSSDTKFTGHMLSAVLNTLDGATTFHIKDGTLDVTPIKRTASIVDALRGKPSSIASWPDKMPFKFLDGEHHFNNGVSKNQQFNFAVQNIKVTGSGGLDYFKNHLDYDLAVSLKQAEGSPLTVSDWLVGVDWPVHCEGTLDASPADMCKPDKSGIQKAIGQTVKKKAEESVKDKIKDKVGNALKGLFGG